jgi:hypothetical protein
MMDNKWAPFGLCDRLGESRTPSAERISRGGDHILKAHLPPGFRLTDHERTALAEIGRRWGRKALQQVAGIEKPDTLLAW